ncbi:serine hydrolase [Microbacterium sp. STN6]|uniref:serine hydrolase domain-containing protein n=1 Tax=Microbacterium sp. STN6 TaxID=2995588 RepID=UPI002260E043|nr:serine hydrolase domain-containing protein [Microbacterium sp. STN6]MCX7522823.1 serine hydrolase [Microbacterium sp. STN6]
MTRWGVRRVTAVAAAGLLALTMAACTGTADPDADDSAEAAVSLPKATSDQLDETLKQAIDLSGATGGIAGVWAPWSGTWEAAKGTTARTGGQPMNTSMTFRIGDITRSMTCTVLLELVDEGRVKLDDPVSRYLPDTVGIGGITLGQLCQNTSGLGDYTHDIGSQFVNNPTRPWPQLELLSDGLAEDRSGPPGEGFADTDAGFILLGMALKKVTGSSWTEMYQKYVFGKLDMTSSSFPESNPMLFPGTHPHGYAATLDDTGAPVCDKPLDETRLSNTMAWTAGGVISTLGDLKVFARALATGSLVSASSHKAQLNTVSMGDGTAGWQGYGLGVETDGPLVGHSGEIPGFITAMLSDPKSGLTVVIMLNNSRSGAAFATQAAMQLASIGSKAEASKDAGDGAGSKGGSKGASASSGRPMIALPWSKDQAAAAMQQLAVCQEAAPAS